MTNVVCIGECMIELRSNPNGGFTLSYAGDAFNAAVYLKRSAPHIDVRFLTATGTDKFSAAMRAAWRAEGIADDLAFAVSDAVPGLYIISVDGTGERSFTYWRSTSAARRWLELLRGNDGEKRLADVDLIYISGISLAILPEEHRDGALELLSNLRRGGRKIAFDPNYRQALWSSPKAARQVLSAAMQIADFILPSEEDLSTVGLALPMGAESVTTCGAAGCRVVAGGVEVFVNGPVVAPEAIGDTAGAGDSFTGAYLAARLDGHEPVAAAKLALAVAARVVTASGAIVPASVSHPHRAVQQ